MANRDAFEDGLKKAREFHQESLVTNSQTTAGMLPASAPRGQQAQLKC